MPKVIEVMYESSVFKPLEKIDLKEKQNLKLQLPRPEKRSLNPIKGVLGEVILES